VTALHPSLQDTRVPGPVSGAAAALAAVILQEDVSIDVAIARTAAHLLSEPRVEVVVTALTTVPPEDEVGWTQLGGRAWLREWAQEGSTRSFLPPPGAGPEAALSQPWLSSFARHGLVALVDRDLLPREGAQDRLELASIGIRSLVATAYLSDGEMFGSLSAASTDAGPWPDILIQDIKLLNASISARLAFEHSRRALAEAIDVGTEAQVAYQQFFGAVGHELRTPLAAVLGYTEVLLDDAEHGTPELVAKGMLRDGPVVVRACEQLLSVVDSLLGAGRTLSEDDQRQDVRVADAVADVVHWHRTPARSALVDMIVEVDPAVTVWAHPAGVRQVLTNLLGNAITHHHHPGGGMVRISTSRLVGESGRAMVRIIVRDDGPGLAAEQMRHVFEPFVRFAGRDTKGSGLGLSISRTIAERDGGAVLGESEQGVGSSFWVELPEDGAVERP
jgi:signal transduction histidine kinase